MTVLFTILQTAAGQGAAGGSSISFWVMIIALFVVMYFFMIRPQRKQQKALEKFRSELKRGDKVVTSGGIFGTVDEIKETSVLIKVDGETKLRVAKNSILRDYSDAQK